MSENREPFTNEEWKEYKKKFPKINQRKWNKNGTINRSCSRNTTNRNGANTLPEDELLDKIGMLGAKLKMHKHRRSKWKRRRMNNEFLTSDAYSKDNERRLIIKMKIKDVDNDSIEFTKRYFDYQRKMVEKTKKVAEEIKNPKKRELFIWKKAGESKDFRSSFKEWCVSCPFSKSNMKKQIVKMKKKNVAERHIEEQKIFYEEQRFEGECLRKIMDYIMRKTEEENEHKKNKEN